MIEIRSLKAFCPVITTCAPDHVESALAVRGLTREEVILAAAPSRSALEEQAEELRDVRHRADDAEAEVQSLEREIMECRTEASSARLNLEDAHRELKAITHERDALRDRLAKFAPNLPAVA